MDDVFHILQHWSKVDHRDGEPCPMRRSQHTAVCLGEGGDYPQLVVFGGLSYLHKALSDVWVLDTRSKRWREV